MNAAARPARGLRFACASMSALFVFAAAVQWNDPDPAVWILAYLFGAAISGAGAFARFWPHATLVYAVGIALWAASLAPTLVGAPDAAFTSVQMQAPAHEEPREAVGLILMAGWTAFLAWRGRRFLGP